MIRVNYIIVSFSDVSVIPSDIPKLRGYFANQFPQDHLFHNHLPDQCFSYQFPCIQYRIINGHPALLGINEGVELMKQVFFTVDNIILGGESYIINEKQVQIVESDFGQSEQFYNYKFCSPWMALNEDNYLKYRLLDHHNRNVMLKSILKRNLITLSKGFHYHIPDFDNIEVEGRFRSLDVRFKNINMLCFKGDFTTNFIIPEYLGLGKQSARGFGVVRKNKENK